MELIKKFSHRRSLIVTTFSFFFLLFINSCSEEPLKIGINLLPEDELLQVYDTTLTVELYTVPAEPLVSRSLSYNLLGSINDPVMGKLKAEYFTNILHGGNVSFKDTIIEGDISIYNIELQLYFDNVYGDSLGFDVTVHEKRGAIPDTAKSNYEVKNTDYFPAVLNIGIPELLNDSTNAVKVQLDPNSLFAQRFISAQYVNYEGMYDTDSSGRQLFREKFPGLYIATEFKNGEGGGIISINNSTSKLVLRTFEKNPDSINNYIDTISNEFSIGNPLIIWDGDSVTSLNMYQFDLSADITSILNDTVNSQPLAYIQSLTGPNTLIEMPTLKDFLTGFKDDLVIHKAELRLPVNQEFFDNEFFKSPGSLGLVNSVSKTFLEDDLPIPYYIGGGLDATNYIYMFNVGNDLNEYMKDDSESIKKYLLFPSNRTMPVTLNEIVPGRVVLNGGNNVTDTPTLKILYSLITK